MKSESKLHWIQTVAPPQPGASAPQILEGTPLSVAWDLAAIRSGITADELVELVAERLGLEVADFSLADPMAYKLIPSVVAWRLQIFPMSCSDRAITLATAELLSPSWIRGLRQIVGRSLSFTLAHPSVIAAAVETAYPHMPEAEPSRPLEPPPPSDPHVLVIDDEAMERLKIRAILEMKGFRVTEAEAGQEALEHLDEPKRFDLVTLDLQMNGMPGSEVLARIRADPQTASLPVIVVTASDQPEVETRLLEAGADDFMVKPVDPERFVLCVRSVLRRRWSAFLEMTF